MQNSRSTEKIIWALCGGPSTEFDVSLSSGRVVCAHMSADQREIRPVIVTRNGRWLISDRTISGREDRSWLNDFFRSIEDEWNQPTVDLPTALARMLEEKVDCVFLGFHGQYGEDGGIQGLLQTAGLAYTGSGILSSAVAFNKAVSLATFGHAGLRIAKSALCTRQNPFPPELNSLTMPVFAKPVCGGSSLGVSLVKDPADLNQAILHALEHDTQALVEEKIEGVEISCGVVDFIENGEVVSRAMPPTLISPTEAEFFDYEAKYVPGKSKDVTPAPLPGQLIATIQDCALKAHKALGCEGMSRTDMIVLPEADAIPTMLETQTIPGMTPTSLLPQQCAAVGISFTEFLDALITHALHRHAQKETSSV